MSNKLKNHVAKKPSNNLDITKTSNQFKTKGFISMSDVNRLYRREEIFKKKFKNIVQTNCHLENQIKTYQAIIKEERSAINFQLGELKKTMMNKVYTFVQEKISKERFRTNQAGQETIKQMMAKFQEVQKESKVNKRVQEQLASIHTHYKEYSKQIDELVSLTQSSNKQYETGIKGMMTQKCNQICAKKQSSQNLYDDTQNFIKKIDQYEKDKNNLIQEEKCLVKYIEKLKKQQEETQKQVQKFKKWAQIVIDKNHRKVFYKENDLKEKQLKILKQNNSRMQVYLHELQQQEKAFLKSQQKQNYPCSAIKISKTNHFEKNPKIKAQITSQCMNSIDQSLKSSKINKSIKA